MKDVQLSEIQKEEVVQKLLTEVERLGDVQIKSIEALSLTFITIKLYNTIEVALSSDYDGLPDWHFKSVLRELEGLFNRIVDYEINYAGGILPKYKQEYITAVSKVFNEIERPNGYDRFVRAVERVRKIIRKYEPKIQRTCERYEKDILNIKAKIKQLVNEEYAESIFTRVEQQYKEALYSLAAEVNQFIKAL